MASIDKSFFGRPFFRSGASVPVQALTAASTGTRINSFGVTTITHTTAGDKAYKLAAPVTGVDKHIFVRSASTAVITIRANSTAVTFYPTTNNLITCTSGAKVSVHLIGLSATSWGIQARSTGVALAGSTLD